MSKYHTVEDNPIEWKSDRNYGVTKNSFIFSFKDCDDIKKPIFSRVINEKSAILNKRTQESRSIIWWRRPYFEGWLGLVFIFYLSIISILSSLRLNHFED
ncbi:unnamed protein product [Rhizophagus irregularis]|nr:unnamed protein product [Rhizophagus irregularis]